MRMGPITLTNDANFVWKWSGYCRWALSKEDLAKWTWFSKILARMEFVKRWWTLGVITQVAKSDGSRPPPCAKTLISLPRMAAGDLLAPISKEQNGHPACLQRLNHRLEAYATFCGHSEIARFPYAHSGPSCAHFQLLNRKRATSPS